MAKRIVDLSPQLLLSLARILGTEELSAALRSTLRIFSPPCSPSRLLPGP